MIPVHRPPAPPDWAEQPERKAAIQRAASFFQGQATAERRQRTFRFDTRPLREAAPLLAKVFWGKCAYCESPLRTPAAAAVDRFRPSGHATNLDGSISRDHYWWLAYEWENLYPCCAQCASYKGVKFPVSGSRLTPGSRVKQETALLLDPCGGDPARHLDFSESGVVRPLSVDRRDPGALTIKVLNLNRSALVKARSDDWSSVRMRLGAAFKGAPVGPRAIRMASLAVRELLDLGQPFLAARRQLVAEWIESRRRSGHLSGLAARELQRHLGQDVLAIGAGGRRRKRVAPPRIGRVAAGNAAQIDRYGTARYIERVEINNFRSIAALDLEVPPGPGPWLMLLGDNGVGKTSVLHAIALALMDDSHRRLVGVKPDDVLRIGQRAGFVRVWLSGESVPVELRFAKRASGFLKKRAGPEVLLLGYGHTRLAGSRWNRPLSRRPGQARVDNLFNPFVALDDRPRWLFGLRKPEFDDIARALLQLLPDDSVTRLSVPARRPPVLLAHQEAGVRAVPVEQLSAGYQSVIALGLGIMGVMRAWWSQMEAAEGIVLIDEIDAHLHPRWQKAMVSKLRSAFPRVQFVATTHSPLIVGSMGMNEVQVLKLEGTEQRVVVHPVTESLQGFRADQILTHDAFGLQGSRSDSVSRKLDHYGDMIGRAKPSHEERAELKGLVTELRRDIPEAAEREEDRLAMRHVHTAIESQLHDMDHGKRERVLLAADKILAELTGTRALGTMP